MKFDEEGNAIENESTIEKNDELVIDPEAPEITSDEIPQKTSMSWK